MSGQHSYRDHGFGGQDRTRSRLIRRCGCPVCALGTLWLEAAGCRAVTMLEISA